MKYKRPEISDMSMKYEKAFSDPSEPVLKCLRLQLLC